MLPYIGKNITERWCFLRLAIWQVLTPGSNVQLITKVQPVTSTMAIGAIFKSLGIEHTAELKVLPANNIASVFILGPVWFSFPIVSTISLF